VDVPRTMTVARLELIANRSLGLRRPGIALDLAVRWWLVHYAYAWELRPMY
jgi:hypothetical protein